MDLKLVAQSNLYHLGSDRYYGRGLVIGRNTSGFLLQLYWLSGRSEGSRNRVLEVKGGNARTEIADASKVKDPRQIPLLLYDAIDDDYHTFIVSNGRQTKDALKGVANGKSLARALTDAGWSYENDEIKTPRITGLWQIRESGVSAEMVILRKSWWDDSLDVSHHQFGSIEPGYGFAMMTYAKDGNPPPYFRGDPWLMPLQGSPGEILEQYWKTLEPDNRVSIAVKVIDRKTGTSRIEHINKYTKVVG